MTEPTTAELAEILRARAACLASDGWQAFRRDLNDAASRLEFLASFEAVLAGDPEWLQHPLVTRHYPAFQGGAGEAKGCDERVEEARKMFRALAPGAGR